MDEGELYWRGWQNKVIRVYFYLQQGLNVANQFRYLVLGIIGIYAVFKLSNPLWMVAMFVPSVIVLVYVGRYNVKKVGKVTEWLSMYHGTHYGLKNFTIQEDNQKLLTEIRDLLKNAGTDTINSVPPSRSL